MYKFGGIIGASPVMRSLLKMMELFIESNCALLVEGESGAGKELISRVIHYNSPRRYKPFVMQTCSGLNEKLLESELFGHVMGAFAGAFRDKQGLFEVAHQGTFFLDEVADMSPALQVRLLRLLQEGTVTRAGATQQREVDVRIIASTTKKLKKLVEEGKFREDLYYRLNAIAIEIPPLRHRKGDIPLLIYSFMDRFSREHNRKRKKIADEALTIMSAYSWPGNVLELEKEVERLVLLSGNQGIISEELLSARIRYSQSPPDKERYKKTGKLRDAISALEKEMIADTLVKNSGNKSKTARDLGLSRVCLIGKIGAYDLGKSCSDRKAEPKSKKVITNRGHDFLPIFYRREA